ncbi:amino acid adenylation domain-containing protein [Aliikangiella marina]|uniref:Amino acid adenylation domain-containing protein n=1 Tax=Aliikangiella marina TaxID=1712262 RepID=A0A545TJH7_9GAMM|nr:non-ribosomal peptide synthetase [Aliikangiella marina]TQV77357.1 amino acid adenylation domain-containing protein [Aliikangiella marina]
MQAQDIILEAHQAGVTFYLKDGRLAYKAKKKGLSQALKSQIIEFKDEIIAYLHQSNEKQVEHSLPPIKSAKRSGKLPLSYAQQRLWFLDQLGEGSSQYNMVEQLIIEDKLNTDLIEQTLHSLVNRHEVLKSHFFEDSSGIWQSQVKDFKLPIDYKDITHLKQYKKQDYIETFVKNNLEKPFNLSEGPLFHVCCINVAQDITLVVYFMHHIISDAWSNNIFKSDFLKIYQDLKRNKAPSLNSLEVSYFDYARWQHEYLSGEFLQQQLSYWKSQLQGVPNIHNLPLDYQRPQKQSFRGVRLESTINAQCSADVKSYCKENNITENMFFHTVLTILLARYSNDTDIIIGTPISGRNSHQLEGVMGFFVNNLVIRSHIDRHFSFSGLIKHNKKVILDAYQYQNLPFDVLVEHLSPKRSINHNPIFQIMFAYQGQKGLVPKSHLGIASKFDSAKSEKQVATRFDIHLHVYESNGAFALNWIFDRDLFARKSMQTLSKCYNNIINSIFSHEHKEPFDNINVWEIPLLDFHQQQNITQSLSQTNAPKAPDWLLHQMFENQVELTPSNIAVKDSKQSLTYLQLNHKANRLARLLVEKGYSNQSLVGICMQRSTNMLVSVLAILKAGSAYLPLEHSYPSNRLQYLIEDSGTEIVIAESQTKSKVAALATSMLVLDEEHTEDLLASYSEVNPNLLISAKELAYVIYTSGSTGMPKGVLVAHRGVVDYCYYGINNYYPDNLDGSIVVSVLSFDATVTNLYFPLFTGGFVELFSESNDLEEFWRYLLTTKNNLLVKITPSHITGLASLVDCNCLSSVNHTFVIGGELLTQAKLNNLKSFFPNSRYFHHYGPTETVVGSTIVEVTNSLPSTKQGISIGRPMANTQAYILDEYEHLTAQGAPGELCIAGVGQARGYLNRASLTADKFRPNPYSNDGKRLYKTGDLARFSPCGNIEFLGRIDQQVKIRGYRIELGEVESHLKKIKGISEAVVMAKQVNSPELQLVAYVTKSRVDSKHKTTDAEIKSLCRLELKKKLPDFLVPEYFVCLDEFPITANRKIAKKRLPIPNISELIQKDVIQPRSELEKKVYDCWLKILKIEDLSVDDDFFELGGHSILATRLVSLLQQVLEIDLPLKMLFEYSSVESLTKHIEIQKVCSEATEIVPLSRGDEIPLSFAQQRLWFIDQLNKGSKQYNVSLRHVVEGDLDIPALKGAVSDLIARHSILRTIYREGKDGPIQIIQSEYDIPFSTVDISMLPVEERIAQAEQIICSEIESPFDLKNDVMLKVKLLMLDRNSFLIIGTIHHIATDGWSNVLLKKEILRFYKARTKKHRIKIANDNLQYADFAAWQRKDLQKEKLTNLTSYWRLQLQGAPLVHSLPLDNSRTSHSSHNGATHYQEIPAELAQKLQDIAKNKKVTKFIFMQTVFALLMSRYSLVEDIVIGTPISGRDNEQLQSMIGLFANSLAIRTQCKSDLSFDELLDNNKRTIIDGFSNHQMPFDLLVETLSPSRSSNYSPIFQIIFTAQDNYNDRENNLIMEEKGEISVNSRQEIRVLKKFVRFDLEVQVQETLSELMIKWNYNSDLFNRDSIENFAIGFLTLLESVCVQPRLSSLKINQIPIMSSAQKDVILNQYSRNNSELLANRIPLDIRQLLRKSNPRIFLLDESLELVPAGVCGMVFMEVVDQSCQEQIRKKRKNPRFVIAKLEGIGEITLYCAGVIARWSTQGVLKFSDKDDPVRQYERKVNNLCLQDTLTKHPDVEEALIINDMDVRAAAKNSLFVKLNKMLAAGVKENARAILIKYVKQQRKAHVLPQSVYVVEGFPINPDGSIDRKKLVEHALNQNTTKVVPRNGTEKQLAAIWQEKLGIDEICVHDNFFELGGHSLVATKVVNTIRESLSVEIALKSLFDSPTIAELAGIVDAQKRSNNIIPSIEPVNRTELIEEFEF